MGKSDYEILIKEKFKVLPLIIIYLLILFLLNYNDYNKKMFISDIIVDEYPNIEFINNFNLSYKHLYDSYEEGMISRFYRSLFQNLYSEIIHNTDVSKISLNKIKEKYNLNFDINKVISNIEYNKKNYQLIGPKRAYDGKQYLEISIDKDSFKDLNFKNSIIYKDYINELFLQSNINIFKDFNSTILNSIEARIDLIKIDEQIFNAKNKFNFELNKIISNLENEKNDIIENIKLDNNNNFNNNINLQNIINKLILEENNIVNEKEIDFINFNIIYLYLLLDELKNINKYDLSNNKTNDVYFIKENFVDIYKNLQSYYNSPSYSVYRLSKLNYLIYLHKKVSTLIVDKNNYLTTSKYYYCSENCFLNYSISKNYNKHFYKNLSNFYIINILTLSIFFIITFLTLKIIIFNFKIKNNIT